MTLPKPESSHDKIARRNIILSDAHGCLSFLVDLMKRLPDDRQSFLNFEIFEVMHGAYSDEPYSKRGSYGYALYIKHSCALTVRKSANGI